jgi:hypothetical protein
VGSPKVEVNLGGGILPCEEFGQLQGQGGLADAAHALYARDGDAALADLVQ